MSVDDIDGEGTHADLLDPGRLADCMMQAATDLQKRARELVHADATYKRDAARRLAEKADEYVALSTRHALVRWDEWRRVEKLRQVAKNLRELGETTEADRREAQAEQLAGDCFATEYGAELGGPTS